MNIFISDLNGINLFYKSFTELSLNQDLVSALLAALNQFTMSEFKLPIESIEIEGFKWIYLVDKELNLLFIGSDTKDVNSEVLRARLNVIKQSFIEMFAKDRSQWKGTRNGNVGFYAPFGDVIENFYSQWTQAESATSFAEFFEILGVFQQILNLIRDVANNPDISDKKENILFLIEETFEIFKKHHDSIDEQELNKISFSKDFGFNIININPTKCEVTLVKHYIMHLIRETVNIFKKELGFDLCLKLFSKNRIFNYIFNNLVLIKNLKLDTFLLQIFLLKW